MFEITNDDIAKLNNEQLRAVVARLCEAELRQRGYSSAYVTSGGHQNAQDGGTDVRVALPAGLEIDGYVPRRATIFQSKAEDMPAGKIEEEMRPNGVIRPSIQNLADQSGAYVIVSSHGSTADTALTNRRNAMADAKSNIPNADLLFVDFYDRTRIASWVRSHECLVPWVRELVGRPIPGWQSYGPWAHAPDSADSEYLLDDQLRVFTANQQSGQGFSALEGLQQIRTELEQGGRVVRLVGLSGVGKTRLVQALFEESVGARSLDPALAAYTNMADDPDPHPTALATQLVSSATRAVLVVDNCPPDLHKRLSEVCRQPHSKLSLITVEYDIREDEPEGTEVFTLKSSSVELAEKLVLRRYPHISQVDARTIAEFSGGNARVAFALATTVKKKETISGLTDEDLFQRLFVQRREGDQQSLHLIAQACSLLYSFQGEDVSDGGSAELIRLGRIIDMTPAEVYRGVAELQRRDVVQRRSVWRAVLPHAIANRLAATALQNIPHATLESELLATERLGRSFSRRLGLLHLSQEARAIVRKWLTADGLLRNAADFNDLGRAMFVNVAPAAPEEALCALERAILGQGEEVARRCSHYADLLRSLAYDASHFQRVTAVLAAIVTAGDMAPQDHGTQVFVSLFQIMLSGTHATVEQRSTVVESLLTSQDERRRELGVRALKALLKTTHFSSVSNFDFGARSRDYGYWPESPEEIQHWFTVAIRTVEAAACAGGPSSQQARTALAEQLCGLWMHAAIPGEIDRVCRVLHERHFWPEGWLAVRQTLHLGRASWSPEILSNLRALERQLRPANTVQKVRAIVFVPTTPNVDLDEFENNSTDDYAARHARTEALAQELGKIVANDEDALAQLLPELVTSVGIRHYSFGQGLADGASDPASLWRRLVTALTKTAAVARRYQVPGAFLRRLRDVDPALSAALLEEALEHEVLAEAFPLLQSAVPLEGQDVERLQRSLVVGKAPAEMYRQLAYGCATDPIPPDALRELLLGISELPSGLDVALEILHMRLDSDKDRAQVRAPELLATGRELLQRVTFTMERADSEDYRLGQLAAACLIGEHGAAVTNEICARLKCAVGEYATNAFRHDDLLAGLLAAQPITTLESLCAGGQPALELGIRVLRDAHTYRHPLDSAPEEDILQWCDRQPGTRYPAMARVIPVLRPGEKEKGTPPNWTNLALRFLEKAPDPVAVLSAFVLRFSPDHGWSGSRSTILESNAVLLDQLEAHPVLRAAMPALRLQLQDRIDQERHRELGWSRQRDERFE